MIRALCLLLIAFTFSVQAKRVAPKPVKPLLHEGVKFTAPLDAGSIGVVMAHHIETGKLLWKAKVYTIEFNEQLERDVQWVFIRKLQMKDGRLIVTDERGQRWSVNPKTGKSKPIKEP